MIKIEQGKKYLGTGGSGFLGGELIERILDEGGEVITVARNEGQLIKLKQKFPTVDIQTGDINNKYSVHRVMKGVTGVFHLAAVAEGMQAGKPIESVKTNVIGSLIVLEEASNVDFVLGISSDKVVQVSGSYGVFVIVLFSMRVVLLCGGIK